MYWENDGKWDRKAKRMFDCVVPTGTIDDAGKVSFLAEQRYWELFPDGKQNPGVAIRILEKIVPINSRADSPAISATASISHRGIP